MNQKKYYFFLLAIMIVQGNLISANKRERGQQDLLEVASVEAGNIATQYAHIDLLNAGEVWIQDRMLSKAACTKHLCVCDQLCAKNISVIGNVSIAGGLNYPMPYKSYVNVGKRVRYITGDVVPFDHILLDPNGDYNVVDSYYVVPKNGLYAITVNISFKIDLPISGFLPAYFAAPTIYYNNENHIIGRSMTPLIYSRDKHYCSVSTTAFLEEGGKILASLDIARERSFWGGLFIIEEPIYVLKNTNFSICYLGSSLDDVDDNEPCSICLELCGGDEGTSCPNTSPGLG